MAELDDSSDFIEVASDEASFDVEREFAIASDYDRKLLFDIFLASFGRVSGVMIKDDSRDMLPMLLNHPK